MINKLIRLMAVAFLPAAAALSSEPVYLTDRLEVSRISDGVYCHISFLETEAFGRVRCNGLVVADRGEAIVFDTPTDVAASAELIDFVRRELDAKISKVIPTHFHLDCLGGLAAFHDQGIASIASKKTIGFARLSGKVLPQEAFEDRLVLPVGGLEVVVAYPGAGHTRDNVVAYVRGQHVLFGGCLVKSSDASKGNLADADVEAWPSSIQTIRKWYPEIKIVVPGHGEIGGVELLEYTEALFAE